MARDSLLTALGYPPALDELYRRLLPQTGRELARISAALLRTPEELLWELAPLIEAGIVRVTGSVVEVATPVEAVRRQIETQAECAARSERLLARVSRAIEVLAAEQHVPVESDDVITESIRGEVWVGGDVLQRVRALVLGEDGDLFWMRPEQWRSPLEDNMVELIGEVVAQGRRSRAMFPVQALREAPHVLAARLRAGEQVRLLPDLPTRLLVIGDSCAVLPEPLGFADLPLTIVRQRGLVEALRGWFEELWGRAAVPALEEAEPLVDLRRFLLEQLAAGAYDEQIARKLGISLRTVRRRVAGLMTELGADSRFQAGVEAARRGWI